MPPHPCSPRALLLLLALLLLALLLALLLVLMLWWWCCSEGWLVQWMVGPQGRLCLQCCPQPVGCRRVRGKLW